MGDKPISHGQEFSPSSGQTRGEGVAGLGSSRVPVPQRWKAGANHILNAIPRKEYELLLPHLKPEILTHRQVIYQFGEDILDCYFISTALLSCMQVMQNGDSVEVGLFGAEGVAGYSALLNLNQSSSLVNVQVAGEAFKIDSALLRQLLPQLPALERFTVRFAYLQALQAQQIAACNGLHEIEQRLARWILMTQDRVRTDTLPFTHDLLAGMLGSRRASVTVAAGAMQKAGIIEYRRGKLHVLQRQKLEQTACECYAAVRSQLDAFVQSAEVFRPYLF
jgi:CRP-like cAMP-binding protein